MKRKIRSIISLFALAVVLTTLIGVPVHAATTYPSATLLNAPSSVKRGNSTYFRFRLKSGSYKRRSNGTWRAGFDLKIYNASGRKVASMQGIYFTGNTTHRMNWTLPTTLVPGQYSMNYRTYYNVSKTSYNFYSNKYCTDKWYYFTVY